MNVSLPEDLRRFAEEQSKEGYSTPSEYIRELIRQDQKRKAQEKLDRLLIEGLSSGEPVRADSAFWVDLRKDAIAKLRSKAKPSKR